MANRGASPWVTCVGGFSIFGAILIVSFVVLVLPFQPWNDPCPCSAIVAYPSDTVIANATGGSPIVPTAPLTIAMMGDQGLNTNSRQVLALMRAEGAGMILHAGDFDYKHSPMCWQEMLFDELASTVNPQLLVAGYFAALGNHDIDGGKKLAHFYTRRLRDAIHPIPAQCCCSGRVGVRATCVWNNVLVLQIGKGTTPCYSEGIEEWIAQELARLSDYQWKVCMFHKNMHLMQLGDKGDDVGWAVYEACRQGGAIVLTGHDHQYARTYLMSQFGPTQTIVSTSTNLTVSPGESFVVLSGLGGYGIGTADPALAANPWWASTLSAGSPMAGFGALFLRIGDASVGGDLQRAAAEFKTVAGDVTDAFTVIV